MRKSLSQVLEGQGRQKLAYPKGANGKERRVLKGRVDQFVLCRQVC